MSPFVRRFVSQGHLVDSGLLTGMLNLIIEEGADYRIIDFQLGKTNQDISQLDLELHCDSAEDLREITAKLIDLGCYEKATPEAVFQPAPADGCAPREFYSTTHHLTRVFMEGSWCEVRNQRMDAVIVLERGELVCKKLRELKQGEAVLCGSQSIRLLPAYRDRETGSFGFMTNDVSSERSVEVAVDKTVEELKARKQATERCVVVAGPVVIHTGGGPALAALIRNGYVQALLSGNALAVHDVESVLYGTSLGIDLASGKPLDQGHRNHMRAINWIQSFGSLTAAVKRGRLQRGVMFELIRGNIPFALAGSIRDDGPLPDTLTDMIEAQRHYEQILRGASLVLMLGTMLHSIAVGNMLSSAVRTICVDIQPSVITKLVDRGSAHTIGIVTDVGLFLRSLAGKLIGSTENGTSTVDQRTPSS
jgi:lysine-ketoglutarate reductase/saccharopine dehydrogenase-like protein (TIGR00300 family)